MAQPFVKFNFEISFGSWYIQLNIHTDRKFNLKYNDYSFFSLIQNPEEEKKHTCHKETLQRYILVKALSNQHVFQQP